MGISFEAWKGPVAGTAVLLAVLVVGARHYAAVEQRSTTCTAATSACWRSWPARRSRSSTRAPA